MGKKWWVLVCLTFMLSGFTKDVKAINSDVKWNDIYFNDENGTYQSNRCYKCLYEDARVNPKAYQELNVADAIEYKATNKGVEVGINNQKFYQLNKDKIKPKQNILGKFTNSAITEQYADGAYDENKLNNFQMYHPYQIQIKLVGNQTGNVIKYEDIDQEFSYEIERINGTLESQGYTVKDGGNLTVDKTVISKQLTDYLKMNYQNVQELEKEIKKLEEMAKTDINVKKLENKVDIKRLEQEITSLEEEIRKLETVVNSPKFWQVINQEANEQQLADLKKQVKDYQEIIMILKDNNTATYHAIYSEDYTKYIEKENQMKVLKACLKKPVTCFINYLDDQDYFKKQIVIDQSLTTPILEQTNTAEYQTKINNLNQVLIKEEQMIKIIEKIQQQIK